MFRNGIRYVSIIVGFVSFIALILIIVLSFNFYSDFRKHSIEQLESYGNLIYKDLAIASADYLFTESYSSIQHIVNEFSSRPDISSLCVINSYNTIVAGTNYSIIGSDADGEDLSGMIETVTEDLPEAREIVVRGPVIINDIYLGCVIAGISTENMNRQLTALLRKNLLWGCFFLIVSIGVAMFGARIITSPISKLSNAIEKFSKGNYVKINSKYVIAEIAELQDIYNSMAEKLLSRGKELERARLEAEKANEAKSLFLANMSHELKTPLNGILGFAELLAETELTANQRSHLDRIKYSGEALSSLIRNLLDLLELESGSCSLNRNCFDVREMILRIDEIADAMIGSRPVFFNSKVFECGYVEADEKRVEQIIIQLLSNAVKFTKEGRINLKVYLDGYLYIELSDTGLGIDAEKLEEAFKPLEQVEHPLTKSHRGAGVGLPLVKLLVDLMKGSITVQSAPGKGTTVKVGIPVDVPDHGKAENAYGKTVKGPANILLVEDEAINRLFLKIILERDGFRVIEAENGPEAIKIFEKEDFDIVLMDIGLPGKNGIDTTIEIVNMEKYKKLHPPIIAVTASSQESIRKKCMEAGMTDFLSKPISEKVLHDAIFSLL